MFDIIWKTAAATVSSLIPYMTIKMILNYLRQFLIND